jgi:hypothetical protein
MPFIRKTEQQLEAMTTDGLVVYRGIVERLFKAIRRRTLRSRPAIGSPCPQDWMDCSLEIGLINHIITFRAMVDAHVDAMLPEVAPEDPCVDPN